MRSLVPAVVLALATVACGPNDGAPSDLSGGIQQHQADEAMSALCDIARRRITAFDDVQAAFQNRAHQTLHHVAGLAQEQDPAAAGALLEAKSVVEADLEQDAAPAELTEHVAALAEATADAIRAIGLSAEACSA